MILCRSGACPIFDQSSKRSSHLLGNYTYKKKKDSHTPRHMYLIECPFSSFIFLNHILHCGNDVQIGFIRIFSVYRVHLFYKF